MVSRVFARGLCFEGVFNAGVAMVEERLGFGRRQNELRKRNDPNEIVITATYPYRALFARHTRELLFTQTCPITLLKI